MTTYNVRTVFDWAQVKLSEEFLKYLSKTNATKQHVVTQLANAGGVSVTWVGTGTVTLEGSWEHILKSQTVFENYLRSCLEDSESAGVKNKVDLAAEQKSVAVDNEMKHSICRFTATTKNSSIEETEVYVNITLSSTELTGINPESIEVVNSIDNSTTESTVPNYKTESDSSHIYECKVSSFERSPLTQSEPNSPNKCSTKDNKVNESVYNTSDYQQSDMYTVCDSQTDNANFVKLDGTKEGMLQPRTFNAEQCQRIENSMQETCDDGVKSRNVSQVEAGDVQSRNSAECLDNTCQLTNMSSQYVCVDPCVNPDSNKIKQKYFKKKDYEELAPFKYFCSLCSFKSKRESHFARHRKLHNEVSELFKCSQCSFTSIRLSHLRRHELNHSNLMLTCNLCRYQTNSQKLLVRHERIKHGAKKMPEIKSEILHCIHCEYQTSRYLFLQRHMRIHMTDASSVQVYQCEQCSYKTNRKEHYMRHSNNIHKEQRPFLCDLCGKAFKRQDALKQHAATHATEPAVICPECGKGCRSQTHLSQHMSVHSSDRSFLCELCGASFKTRAVQRKHMFTIHQHPKAFLCSHCSRKFSTKFALRRHIKQHSFLEKRPKHEEQEPPAPMYIPNTGNSVRLVAMDTVFLPESTRSHPTQEQNVTIADSSREGEKITLQFSETIMQPNSETAALVYLTGTFTSL